MTIVIIDRSATAPRWQRVASSLFSTIKHAFVAYRTRRALSALPDDLLSDIGLNRCEIDFVAEALASGTGDPRVRDTTSRNMATSKITARALPQTALRLSLVVATGIAALIATQQTGLAQDAQIKRGKYLVTLGGCNDCHTPGYFFGKPEMARFLGGSEVGFEIPGLGVFHGPNLTPDAETGLGTWSSEQIATAITTGKRPDGRILSPIMPWHAFASMTPQDVRAIAAFLKSLPPVKNKVPGPFGPNEAPSSFVMKIVPPPAAATQGAAAE